MIGSPAVILAVVLGVATTALGATGDNKCYVQAQGLLISP